MIAERDWARMLVFGAFVALGFGIAVGAYFGFLGGFRFFQHDAYFGEVLTVYTLEATFFITLFLVFASAAVSGIWTLFHSPENQFLLTTPISRYKLLASRFLENAFASAWPMLLLGVPAIAAYARSNHPSCRALVLFTLTLSLLFFSTVALAAFFDFVLVRFFRTMRGIRLIVLVAALILFGITWVGKTVLPQNLPQLFYAESLEKKVAPANLISAHFYYTPTHLAVQYLFSENGNVFSWMPFFVSMLLAAASGGMLWMLARTAYLKLLSQSLEGIFVAKPEDTARASTGLKKFPVFLRSPFGAFLEKDVLVFFRSRRELTRALFLVLMLFLYLFLFRRLRRYGVELAPETLSRILLFNFAVIGYFVTTLALRFVFPLISLEGKSAWATLASPLTRTTLFWQKLVLGLGAVLCAIVPLAIGSVQILHLHGLGIAVFLRVVVGMCAVLVTVSLATGALWPNFRDTEPDKLSTTMPGFFATALSLIYVAFASFIGYLSIRAYLFEKVLLPPVIAPLVVLNITVIVAALWPALRRIKTIDVTA